MSNELLIDFGDLEDTAIDHVFVIMGLRAGNARLGRELAAARSMAEFNRTGWEGSAKMLASVTLWLADKRAQSAFWEREARSLKSELSVVVAAVKRLRELEGLMGLADEALAHIDEALLAHDEADNPTTSPDYDNALRGDGDD